LRIDLVIPVLNEQETLESQIQFLDSVLSDSKYIEHDFRILIADNGSTDLTPEIGKKLAEKIMRVEYISVGKKGVGLALKVAWQNSGADVVGYMDLDFATDIKHLNDVINVFSHGDVDVMNASRLLPKSIVRNRSFLRDVTSHGLNLILRFVFRTKITDAMCGFKFIRRNNLNTIVKNGANSDGWFFSSQLLLVSEMLGLKVREIPVSWTDDGNSKVKIIKLSKEYLKEIWTLRSTMKKSAFRGFVRL
jgi:glycosyltransferase involved in cell wall biosynthesis